MKRLLILATLALMGAQRAEAQSFSLSNYSPVTVINDPFSDTESHVDLANSSLSDKQVTVERTITALANGHVEFFCFGAGATGLCYPPGTAASNGNDVVSASSTDQSFKATVRPMGNYGYTSIHYRFFDTANPADSVGVDLAWDFTTSLSENGRQFGFTKPLQNPADAFTVFNYNLPSSESGDRLLVYNMLGSLVRSVEVPGKNGTLVLHTSDLKSGVYLVSYISMGRVKDSSRLVVSHR